MSGWVRVETRFPHHPKVLDIGPLGEALWLRGLCYAAEQLTDGYVPASYIKRMGDLKGIVIAAKLVAAGLWQEAPDGYRIHDYLDWQQSRDEIAEISSKRADAGRKGGKQKASNGLANGLATDKQIASNLLDQCLSKPLPEEEVEEELEENERTPPVVPRQKDASRRPVGEPPKPRTEKQLKADAVYEQKMRIVEAYFRGLGVERDTLPWTQRKAPSLAALGPVILASAECTPELIEPLTRYTKAAYQWRDGKRTPSLAEVLTAFSEWNDLGRPEHPPPRPQRATGRASPATGLPTARDFAEMARELERQGR